MNAIEMPDLSAMQAESDAKKRINEAGYDCKHVYRTFDASESDVLLGHEGDFVPSAYALFLDDDDEPWTAIFAADGNVVCTEGW